MSMRAIMAVRDYSQTSGAEYALMLVIADGVDSSVGLMRGRDTYQLARMAHLCHYDADESQMRNARRRCQRMLTKLMQRGELIVITGGYRAKNQYVIPILLGEPGYDPQPCTDTDHDCNRYHTPLDVSREQEAMNEADRRLNLENKGRRLTPANVRRAAPEPPLRRPIDHPTQKEAREAAPEPPLRRPIDHPTAAPEPPLRRPLSRTVSHSNPINNPMLIPGADSSTGKMEGTETGPADVPSPPLPPRSQDAGYIWSRAVNYLRAGRLGSQELASWIVPLRLVALDKTPGRIDAHLIAPGTDHARIVEQRYHGALASALGSVYGLPASRVTLSIAMSVPMSLEVAQ